jgi:AraC-like DNA-binding protein
MSSDKMIDHSVKNRKIMHMPVSQDEYTHIWSVQGLENILLFKARFHGFTYTKHTHPEFAIGVIEVGMPSCFYHGSTHPVPPGTVITVNPEETHTGEPTANASYHYWMAYIPMSVVHDLLQALYGHSGMVAYFPHLITHDFTLSSRLLEAFRLLEHASSSQLQAHSTFFQVLMDLFARHGQPQSTPRRLPSHPAGIRKAREFIQVMAPTKISLDDMAECAGLSRFHFLRLFHATTGMSPYGYLLQRRVELAKQRIEEGWSLVQAALDAGFADQSHLTRRFKAMYGVTPGQYRQAAARK